MHLQRSSALDELGHLGGMALAPLAALLTLARRARGLHPDGVVYRAHVRVAAQSIPGALAPIASAMEGAAIVRFSGALWRKGKLWPDILGLALRLTDRDAPVSAHAREGDQDILFATLSSPWTLGFAPFATNVASYLANDFNALAPFEAGLEHPIQLRVRPPPVADAAGTSREADLERAVEEGRAVLAIQARTRTGMLRHSAWSTVADLVLEERARVNQRTLQFSPFRNGRGLRPSGFLTEMRRAPYAASQAVRGGDAFDLQHYVGVGAPLWFDRAPSSRAPEH
ncbi:hypothetical protein BH09MYX1_BH09MYX1_63520 [soil metagenome]